MQNYLHPIDTLTALKIGLIPIKNFTETIKSDIRYVKKYVKFLTKNKMFELIELLIRLKKLKDRYYFGQAGCTGDSEIMNHAAQIDDNYIHSVHKFKRIVKKCDDDTLLWINDKGHLHHHQILMWLIYYERDFYMGLSFVPGQGLPINNKALKHVAKTKPNTYYYGTTKFRGDIKLVDYFIRNNLWEEWQEYLLECALNSGRLDVVKYLIGKGCRINLKMIRITKKNWECYKYIFACGQNIIYIRFRLAKGIIYDLYPSITSIDNRAILNEAVYWGYLPIIKRLKDLIHINHLHMAIYLDNIEIVRYIVKHKLVEFDKNYRDLGKHCCVANGYDLMDDSIKFGVNNRSLEFIRNN